MAFCRNAPKIPFSTGPFGPSGSSWCRRVPTGRCRPVGSPGPRRGPPMPAIETRLSRRALIAGSVAGGLLANLPAQSQTGSPTMETTIHVDGAVTTLVNVFAVEPDNQPKLLALLQDGT